MKNERRGWIKKRRMKEIKEKDEGKIEKRKM